MHWICYVKLLVGLFCVNTIFHVDICQAKACLGTSNGLSSRQTSEERRLQMYRDMYTNCTYVEGNLELIFLLDPKANLSFLSDIEEVTGYVLIVGCISSHIPLTSLRIIRGMNRFYPDDDSSCSLCVYLNYDKYNPGIGLKQLDFVSLNEIMNGDVFLFNNNELCFENTINWKDILSGEGAVCNHHFDSADPHRHCGECDSTCHQNMTRSSHCWGAGPSQCQRLNRVVCSLQCDARCYGPFPQDCCHMECAGGCDGPLPTQCWACLHFDNNGTCVGDCPRRNRYNPSTFQNEPNPDFRFAYGSKCVKECPAHLVEHEGACIQDCGEGFMVKEKRCMKCDGPCPKTCIIPTDMGITAHNIANLSDCTVIKGSITIYQHSFDGDARNNISGLHPSELSVLESVQEVTGFVKIQGQHDDFKDLSFLRNLRLIQGRQVDDKGASLHVVMTSLESLNLQSLESVKHGKVLFWKNRYLCYPPLIRWKSIMDDEDSVALVSDNGADAWCKTNGHVCDPQCTDDGCWGQGDTNCLHCKNFHLANKVCLLNCNSDPENNLYSSASQECKPCDPECEGGCFGAGPGNCTRCRHVKDGPFCKRQCPESKYPDSNDRVCQSCHINCDKNCTGPHNRLGPGGCNTCSLAIVDEYGNVTECLPKDGFCPEGLYPIPVTDGPMQHKKVCKTCHEECNICTGYSTSMEYCMECAHYEQEGECVSNCSENHFTDNQNSICLPCDETCAQCHGPTHLDCIDCQTYKIYWEVLNRDRMLRFNCSKTCPEQHPVRLPDFGELKETVCVTSAEHRVLTGKTSIKLIVGLVLSLVFLFIIAAIVFGYFWKQRSKSEENKLRLTARMSGLEESEPLTPTGATPDMATLRLIKESELRRGNIIGSGAFGTVYKGFWIPEGETVKIPVAIKVLQEGTSPSLNKELLEEARIMASVYHPCCIRILAVCMTTQMMLVTQLMPLGCLLEYVRKNKMNIGSKVLLNWCTQIAKGMSYLEERQIVHRDLAARNVLVQSPVQVKITDFGLAKLLDYNEEEFHASGGKMPIKWLALECIQHRIFTHKSDVWSFGVTIWELFTYGQRPYESVRARDIPDLLEKGERLPQPSICTIDVYMIMIKCWMLDAESRPSFKELADEFAKMARDPGRYLVIHGDKLMRLPSHSQDMKENLLRNMSIASDTTEDFRIMEADDYLQPRGSMLEPPHTPPLHIREDSKDSSTYDDRHNNTTNTSLSTSAGSREGSRERDYPVMACGRREKKYSGLEAAAAARRQREIAPNGRDSLNSRYCSDPCKVPPEHWDSGEFPDMPAPPTPIEPKPPGDLDIRLPVDEDDYLQPQSSNPRAYMDLVDGPDYLASDENSNPATCDSGYASKQDTILPQTHYLDMSPTQRTAVDNPEYYERSQGDSVFPSININGVKNEKQPPRLQNQVDSNLPPPPSHDYINDYSAVPNSTTLPSVYIDPRSESRV